jgi:hypothetical protein
MDERFSNNNDRTCMTVIPGLRYSTIHYPKRLRLHSLTKLHCRIGVHLFLLAPHAARPHLSDTDNCGLAPSQCDVHHGGIAQNLASSSVFLDSIEQWAGLFTRGCWRSGFSLLVKPCKFGTTLIGCTNASLCLGLSLSLSLCFQSSQSMVSCRVGAAPSKNRGLVLH